jgi:glutaconate CoA-transferase, subunit A
MPKQINLQEAVKMIPSWSKIYLGGFKFTRCPMALAAEMIAQKKHDLTVYAGTLGLHHDFLVKEGVIKRLECAYGGLNEEYRFENIAIAAEDGLLKIEDFSLGAMTTRLHGGALNVPFMPVKSMASSSLEKVRNYLGKKEKFMLIHCPFTGERVGLVESVQPEFAVIVVQYADEQGNFVLAGEQGLDLEAVRAARVTFVVAEEIVETKKLAQKKGVIVPGLHVNYVIEAVKSAKPTAMPDCYDADLEEINKLLNS